MGLPFTSASTAPTTWYSAVVTAVGPVEGAVGGSRFTGGVCAAAVAEGSAGSDASKTSFTAGEIGFRSGVASVGGCWAS